MTAGSDSTIDDCWNSGEIHAKDTAGGISAGLGNIDKGSVMTGCYNTGSVTGESHAGVAVAGGDAAKRSVIANCYNKGTVSSENFAAGVTMGQNCAVVNCFNLGGISSQNSGISGAAGISSTGGRSGDGILWIANCYSAGTLSEKADGATYQNQSVELESIYYQDDTAVGYFFNRKSDDQDDTYKTAKE